ncbi:hypothetical protein ACE4V3_05420 (plasmid) [Borrelia recurrentis]|uniref:hypothetical protein n=1 Tax=Borrelia recurrentis TaxID=44449 RepID=UPI0036713437
MWAPKKKYAPVASVMRQRRVDVPFKKSPFGVTLRGLTDSGISVDSPGAAAASAPGAPAVPAPGVSSAPDDPDDVDPVDGEEFDSYFKDPDNETPEESMQKEKEIKEIEGKIPVEVKEILKKNYFSGT